MNYTSGEQVKLGDKVELEKDNAGMVVCVFDDREYGEGYPETEWSYITKGVLINFPLYGLIHYESSLEPDIRLIGRAK